MYKPQFFVKEVGKNGQWTLQLHLDIQFTHTVHPLDCNAGNVYNLISLPGQ